MAEVSVEKKFLEYKKKAEQGDAIAQCSLGYCYEVGNGTAKNYKLAFEWYKKSADQGYKIGIHNVGICYYNGYGVEKDYNKALKCFKASAQQNYANSFYMIGRCYELGYGVDKNLKKALFFMKKGAKLNSKKAIERIPVVEKQLAESKKPVRPVGIIALVWAVLSIGYLIYGIIDGFSYLNSLSSFRTDFVKYVLVGGLVHTFFLAMSFFGISLIPIIPELIRGERKTHTTRKLVIITCVIALLTLFVLISLPDFSLKTHGGLMFVVFLIEAIVAIYMFLVAEDVDITQLGYGLILFVLGAIFLFYLSSYLKAIDRGFLSFLAGFPVGIFLAMPVIYPIVMLVEKFGGNGSGYSSGTSSSNYTAPASTQSSSSSSSEGWQHVKTEVRSSPKGAPYKGIIGDRQDYDVEVIFTFRNAKGKEKTVTKPHTYYGGNPSGCDFSTRDAEYQFGYVINEETK